MKNLYLYNLLLSYRSKLDQIDKLLCENYENKKISYLIIHKAEYKSVDNHEDNKNVFYLNWTKSCLFCCTYNRLKPINIF